MNNNTLTNIRYTHPRKRLMNTYTRICQNSQVGYQQNELNIIRNLSDNVKILTKHSAQLASEIEKQYNQIFVDISFDRSKEGNGIRARNSNRFHQIIKDSKLSELKFEINRM